MVNFSEFIALEATALGLNPFRKIDPVLWGVHVFSVENEIVVFGKYIYMEYSKRIFQDICLVGLCLNPISSFFTEMWEPKFEVQKPQNFEFHQKQKILMQN